MDKWYIDKGPDSDVIISSRVRLARNFKKYPFPHKTTPEQQRQIIEETKNALFSGNRTMSENFSYIDFTNLDSVEKAVLVEKHIVSKELLETNRICGVLLSKDERISIMINEEDHLRIQCLATGLQLSEAWETCTNIDDLLSESIDFSWDENIGYLTSCPTNIGTAIRASVMMHLPALTMTGYIKPVLEALGKLGMAVRGMYGENTEASGNMFQLSNQITLGKSEEDILLSIKNITSQIIEQERSLRQHLLTQNKYQLEDKIFRSYGILKNSRIISTDECLRRLSDLRLGVDMGIIDGISIENINELMLMVQPGNLQKREGRILDANERDIVRAKLVRDMLNKQKNY
ncbi:putative ATP:guanido phosphotransferase [Thermoclostridium stercorarium subsp. stercorarium DSM 8532]|uniref:Protein-arginine kinase n=1 Tax=Thermoclostridium stercorarium (strain ATCC 35414 / DSM 8532 / NCIMB 11754) TaxID=1121335 RepID=L7VKW3_THES1|nr:protein arginine kinase [Thermoclostridium stercorarium]AGC67304.1 putative ATP:guanido phosphotransferase [Thermoclostridium stercorarium subsp. stercorarium DSM 8532]AGI38368.1 arginine kinase [Thermoclostridium stercorarium subsp. stercorarium DSM 8532]UZQ85878.1 protein arginine kinase [Thermoclostridium stercorarium]